MENNGNTDSNRKALLEIQNLVTSFRIDDVYYAAVDDVSVSLYENEIFAVVGESGSGKSAMALSILRLHNENYTKIEGKIMFDGKNLLELDEKSLNDIRGNSVSMIFQDPLSALNPLMTIGQQIEESLYYHSDLDKNARKEKTLELLKDVEIVNPELTYKQYPHELSGGMRQRVMIALALVNQPAVVIADEPTTALDVTIQAQILYLLKKLQHEMKSGILLITHDLGVVAEVADRVAVMYAGQIVELAPAYELFKNPVHPYTRLLLASTPDTDMDSDENLKVIKGMVPPLNLLPREGCRIRSRIPWIPEDEHETDPTYHEVGPDHIVLCTCYKNFKFEGEDE